MRKSIHVFVGSCSAAAILLGAVTVGSGPYSALIQQSFVNAFARGQFSSQVNLPPLNNVHALGLPGLVQEFQGVANPGLTFALVKPDPTVAPSANDTLQMNGDLYAFFNSIGVGKTGYPINDSTPCPVATTQACAYQLFTNDYALFVYGSPAAGKFSVSDPFYTAWILGGGTGGAGAAIAAASAVTSKAGTAGTQQVFQNGAIFSYASGIFSVTGSIYSAFAQYGGALALGFPTSAEIVLASGMHQQVFEKGRIQWTPGNSPVVLFPISQIYIENTGVRTLSLGSSAMLGSLVYDTQGNTVTGRALTWSTSNGNVISIVGNGDTATIKAVGVGEANISLSGEGQVAAPVVVEVTPVCCGIGDGAPTPAISQAFQAAAARNHLVVALPNPSPVVAAGAGYIQTLSPYVIAESAGSSVAYVIGGAIYAAYLANGGFTGPLGYPASDVSAGGAQSFVSGAVLGGSPVRLMPVPIGAKWLLSGLGNPTGDAAGFVSLNGATGNSQAFASGVIFGILSGSRAGQAWISSGLILARYLALQGPSGTLGLPAGDPFMSGLVQVQNFDNGYIDLQPGAAVAVEHFYPRNPAVTTLPATVAPGGRVHVSMQGFAFGATLGVTVTGQPGFSVTVPGGEFGWDIVVPSGAASGTVVIQAKATASTDAASASYTITSLAQLRPGLTVVSGDQQTGFPGSTLVAPLMAVLRDLNGNPLAGVPVSWSASAGASATVPAVTDSNGNVAAMFRLPPAAGVALFSLTAGGQVVTFSALAAAGTIQGVPAFSGLNALAAVIRYYQNSGALPTPNGLATPASLTGPNPWAATLFAGLAGGVSIETPSLDRVRDLLNAGSPVVVGANGSAVVAVGVNGDGSVVVSGGISLSAQDTIASVIRIVAALSTPNGFVISSPVSAGATAASVLGTCANSVDLQGTRFIECDGSQAAYAVQGGSTILDLSTGSVQPIGSAVEITRNGGALKIAPLATTIGAVVGLSPGAIFTIYGTGLANSTIAVNGQPVTVLASLPFQVNAVMPAGVAAGSAVLQVGTVTQNITIPASAPAIFVVVNQDGSVNGQNAPAQRGQYVTIYCTGLGATAASNGLQVAMAPVRVLLNNAAVTPSFAGLTPGFEGLYQVNVQIPASTVPGSVTLALQEAGQASNVVHLIAM